MTELLDFFRRCDFFSEENKMRTATNVAGRFIGTYISEYLMAESDGTRYERNSNVIALSNLVWLDDEERIIAFLQRELPECMASIPDHRSLDFMSGFSEGYDVANGD